MVLKFCSDYSRIHFSVVNISTNGGYYVSDHKGKKAGQIKIYLMDVVAPRVAANCLPGQFIIAKVDKEGERIPLTICDYDRENGTITIVFQIVGASTEKMSKLVAGDSFTDFVGPLGVASEFTKEDPEALKNKKFLFVAGGVGAAPGLPTGKVAA